MLVSDHQRCNHSFSKQSYRHCCHLQPVSVTSSVRKIVVTSSNKPNPLRLPWSEFQFSKNSLNYRRSVKQFRRRSTAPSADSHHLCLRERSEVFETCPVDRMSMYISATRLEMFAAEDGDAGCLDSHDSGLDDGNKWINYTNFDLKSSQNGSFEDE